MKKRGVCPNHFAYSSLFYGLRNNINHLWKLHRKIMSRIEEENERNTVSEKSIRILLYGLLKCTNERYVRNYLKIIWEDVYTAKLDKTDDTFFAFLDGFY